MHGYTASLCIHPLNASFPKLENDLGWKPIHTSFSEGLDHTIAWYTEHEDWWRGAKDATEAKYAKQGQ